MHVLLIGTGYVGLVTAAALAEMGHVVLCLDIDARKIEGLKRSELPIYEPGLRDLVERNSKAGRLLFTTSLREGLAHATLCLLALPTPSLPSGECDLSFLTGAVEEIGRLATRPLLIVNKSTAPVGTADRLQALVSHEIAVNPEFLKEGAAVADCMKPDRIILGVQSAEAAARLKELYAPFMISRDKLLIMDPRSAEMTKYAANAMLALRISFMNELSALCEEVGSNITEVRRGIGSDPRIGPYFLYPGVGYGGSCFPKDIRALAALGREREVPLPLVSAIEQVNERQKRRFVERIEHFFTPQEGLQGKTLALWGLSFKPDTDDIREAPALAILTRLLAAGAHVRAYDPVAMPHVQPLFPQVTFCRDEYDAAQGADAILLVTEWKQFRSVDWKHLAFLLRQRVVFDGRNQYVPEELEALGFSYTGVGIPHRETADLCPL